MFAVPVIERELMVRTRTRVTHWQRSLVAALAGLACAGTLTWSGQLSPVAAGPQLFRTLTALAFVFCLVEGIRVTCDCLSRERREGTIGLLFLTDLRPFEIVFGKLVAASATAFCSLIAAAPALVVPLLFGGVNVGEFWRTQLVLLNTLFVAAACGMVASARHLEQIRSLLAGLTLFFALTLEPVLVQLVLPSSNLPTISPATAVSMAGDVAYRGDRLNFWLSLLLIQAVAWGMIATAAAWLARDRCDDVNESSKQRRSETSSSGYRITPSLHAGRRRRPGPEIPVSWLVARQPGSAPLVWIAVLTLASGAGIFPWLLFRWLAPSSFMVLNVFHWLEKILAPALVAVVATRALAEARRSGILELLLTTPLSSGEIVRAHWLVFWRQVRLPLIVLGGPVILVQLVFAPHTVPFPLLFVLTEWLMIFTIGWVGMYCGSRAPTPSLALGRTLLMCVVAPLLGTWVLSVVIVLLVPRTLSGPVNNRWLFWISWIVRLGYTIGLLVWARRRLAADFRKIVSGD